MWPETSKASEATPFFERLGAARFETRCLATLLTMRRNAGECGNYASAGTGSAVTDLIFSIAKREVTFFSVTVPISFL